MSRFYQPAVAATEAHWRHRPTITALKDGASEAGIDFGMMTTNTKRSLGRWSDLIAREASIITNGSDLLWKNVHPSDGVYSFTAADAFATWAAAQGLGQRHGGHLIWHHDLPAYVEAVTNVAASRALAEGHIETVMEHMAPLGLTHWNVINEPINNRPGDGFADTYWYQVHGDDFATWAFQKAREVRPTDTLIWNQHLIEAGSTQGSTVRAATYAAIDRALDEGASIDGFGTQMHLPGESGGASAAQVTDWLNTLATDFGLDIYVTELDVSDAAMTLAEREQELYDLTFQYVGAVCRDVPALQAITCWGVTDSDTWLISEAPRADGYGESALPFNDQGRPKLMAQALLDSFALRPAV